MTFKKPSMARTAKPSDRQHLIKLIHVAKRDIGLDEDTYRGILRSCSSNGKTSSSDLTIPELEKAISHMKKCGFKVKPKGKPTRKLASDDQSKMIRGLWLELHEYGYVENPSESALASFVKRMTKIDDLHWLDTDQASKVTEELKQWRGRDEKKINSLLFVAIARGLVEQCTAPDEFCRIKTGSPMITKDRAKVLIKELQGMVK